MTADRHAAALKAWQTRGRAQQGAGSGGATQLRSDYGAMTVPPKPQPPATQADQPNPSDYEEELGGAMQMVRRPDGTPHPRPVNERYLSHQDQWEKTRPGAAHPVLASGAGGKRWVRRVATRQIDNGPEALKRYTAEYEYRDKHGEVVDVTGMKLKPYDRADAMLHQQRGGNPLHPPEWAV